MTRYIQVQVDDQIAEEFEAASESDKQTLDLLLGIWFREVRGAKRSLTEVMDDMGAKAQSRGLNAEILEDILRDE